MILDLDAEIQEFWI